MHSHDTSRAADDARLATAARMMRSTALLVAAVVLPAMFGAIERHLQDHSTTGWYLANVAAVWLAIPFVFGALAVGATQAWMVGFVAEMSALAGFYGYMRFGENSHEPLHLIAFWTFCGVGAGPIFGLLVHHWRRLRSEFAALILGGMFVGEAVLLGLARARPTTVTALETVAGVLVAVMLLAAARWRKRQTPRRR